MIISMNKTYRTVGGRKVRIYAIDGGGAKPVHGAIKQDKHTWFIFNWHEDGRCSYHHHTRKDDLVEDQGG